MINTAQLSTHILDALIKRGHSTTEIARMSPREAFEEYCQWHGILGSLPNTLYNTVVELERIGDDK